MPGPAGSSSTAGSTAGRWSPRAGRGSATTDSRRRWASSGRRERSAAPRRTRRAAACAAYLARARQPVHDEVGVRVAREQRRLEEDEAGRPDGGRSAEPRQDLLRDDRLHQEQQEGADEDGRGVEGHRGGIRARASARLRGTGNRAFYRTHGKRPAAADLPRATTPDDVTGTTRPGPSRRASGSIEWRFVSTWSSDGSTRRDRSSERRVP